MITVPIISMMQVSCGLMALWRAVYVSTPVKQNNDVAMHTTSTLLVD